MSWHLFALVWGADYVRRFAGKVENDAYGSAWATLSGKSPVKLMLEAHADEIGFMVKHVTKEGFLHIDRIGGSDYATARGRKVIFQGVHQLMGSDLGPAWAAGEQRNSKMVFIGINLPKDIFLQGLEQCLV